MTEREIERRARHRLAVLQQAEEVSGSELFGSLRRGELAALRRADIDLKEPVVHVRQSLTELPGSGYSSGRRSRKLAAAKCCCLISSPPTCAPTSRSTPRQAQTG